MNLQFLDPPATDFPEIIDGYIDIHPLVGGVLCFNSKGTFLAIGCNEGSLIIWDFLTRSRRLTWKPHQRNVTDLRWSCSNQTIFSCGADFRLVQSKLKYISRNQTEILFQKMKSKILKKNLEKKKEKSNSEQKNSLENGVYGEKRKREEDEAEIDLGEELKIEGKNKNNDFTSIGPNQEIIEIDFQNIILSLHEHPKNEDICGCTVFEYCGIWIIDFKNKQKRWIDLLQLKYKYDEEMAQTNSTTTTTKTTTTTSSSSTNSSNIKKNVTAVSFTFDKSGDLIYCSPIKGCLFILNHNNNQILQMINIQGKPQIKFIEFNSDFKYFLMNCSDRIIRVYDAITNTKKSDFQDPVNRVHWRKACFSHNSDFLIGGSGETAQHKIYIWSLDFGMNSLAKILEGPNDAILHLSWHPNRPIIVSSTGSGFVYIWSQMYTEKWSSYAPEFVEIDHNEEYFEKENEFDEVVDEDLQKEKRSRIEDEENIVVDVFTIDRNTIYEKNENQNCDQDQFDPDSILNTMPLPDIL